MKARAGRMIVSIAWSLFVVLFLQFLDYHGAFSDWNARVFNWILSSRSSKPETDLARKIVTVEIDDAAYDTCFHSQSPMDPERILNLVANIQAANPKTIGVDIRTESPIYARALKLVQSWKPTIVWVTSYETLKAQAASFPAWLFSYSDELTLSPLPVLGTRASELPDTSQTQWGIPVYPREADGAVRRFPRTVELDTPQHGPHERPTWAAQVADAFCSGHCRTESADEVYISYAGSVAPSFKMLDLFTCPGEHEIQPGAHSWERFKYAAENSLVLLGGSFREGGDFYPTPIGVRPGLTVNAYAVKADLSGSGFEEVRQPTAWLLDWGMGLVMILAGPFFFDEDRPMRELLAGTGLVVVVCVASLFVAHGRYLIGFGGEGMGVLMDQASKAWNLSRRRNGELKPVREG